MNSYSHDHYAVVRYGVKGRADGYFFLNICFRFQTIDYKTVMQAGYTTVSFILDFSSDSLNERPVVIH